MGLATAFSTRLEGVPTTDSANSPSETPFPGSTEIHSTATNATLFLKGGNK